MRRVRVKKHAIERFELRAPDGFRDINLRRQVEIRLASMLRMGVIPARGLDVKVDLGQGMVAVCVPSIMGGWDLVTVYQRDFLKGGAG